MKKSIYWLATWAVLASTFLACGEKKEDADEQAGVQQVEADSSILAEAGNQKVTQISFSEKKHNFGNIEEGDVVKHTFTFTNTGNQPLVISNIQTTCGCTAPEYSEKPVMPGQTGQVTVQFNSMGKMGQQEKKITIYANIPDGMTQLVITANVEKAKGPKTEALGGV